MKQLQALCPVFFSKTTGHNLFLDGRVILYRGDGEMPVLLWCISASDEFCVRIVESWLRDDGNNWLADFEKLVLWKWRKRI